MTDEQYHAKMVGEIRDLNSYLKVIATELTRIEKILNRTSSPTPDNHEVSEKEDETDGD